MGLVGIAPPTRWRTGLPPVRVTGARSWSLAGADAAPASLAPLPALPDGPSFHPAPDPERPDGVAAGPWRRMSRVARLAVAVAAPLVVHRTDRVDLALFWGTGVGEFSSTAAFLRTLFQKGPAGASPLLFQNAVHNAPAGHLSIALGLKGPSETLCAGPLTALRTLERALTWVAVHRLPALVVVGDDLGPDVRQGYTFADVRAPMSEGAAAFLLEPIDTESAEEPGVVLRWLDAEPEPGDWQRGFAYPERQAGDPSLRPLHASDAHFGLSPVVDALALVACVQAGHGAVAWGGAGGPIRVVIG